MFLEIGRHLKPRVSYLSQKVNDVLSSITTQYLSNAKPSSVLGYLPIYGLAHNRPFSISLGRCAYK